MPNAELAYRVLDHIDAHPESWDQAVWHCGTTACFAGWAVLLSRLELRHIAGYGTPWVVNEGPFHGFDVSEAACELLKTDATVPRLDGPPEWLFAPDNDRAKLGELVKEIFGPRPDHM